MQEYMMIFYELVGDKYVFKEEKAPNYVDNPQVYTAFGSIYFLYMYVPLGEEKLYSGLLKADLQDRLKKDIEFNTKILKSL